MNLNCEARTDPFTDIGQAGTSLWLNPPPSVIENIPWAITNNSVVARPQVWRHVAVGWQLQTPDFYLPNGMWPGTATHHNNMGADTVIHLQTGGRSGSHRQNLFCLSGTATANKTLSWPYFEPMPMPEDMPGNPDHEIPPGQITMNGKALGNDGKAWLVLPDGQDLDITPQVKGNDFFTFTVEAQKYQLTSATRHLALTDKDPARPNLGVGEEVDLGFTPPLTSVDVDWTTTAGSVVAGYFTAPSNAPPVGGAVTVTAALRDKGVSVDKTFTVLEPSGYDHASTFDLFTNNFGIQPWAVAEMYIVVHFAPTSVSFYRIAVEEVGQDASSIWGCFTNPATYGNIHSTNSMSQKLHHYSYTFVQVTDDNAWGQGYADHARGSANAPTPVGAPWISGGFTWVIPAKWKIGDSSTNSMPGWSQIMSVDGNGTFKVDKFGLWVTRTLDDIIVTGLTP